MAVMAHAHAHTPSAPRGVGHAWPKHPDLTAWRGPTAPKRRRDGGGALHDTHDTPGGGGGNIHAARACSNAGPRGPKSPLLNGVARTSCAAH
jgi:hypothetical protein